MKLPLIGLTMDHSPATDSRTFAKGVDIYYLNDVYVRYIEKAPCLFIALPTTGKESIAEEMIDRLDGLLLTGGNDVFSAAYGEAPLSDQWQADAPRTWFEMALIKKTLQVDKPIFAICRGCQMLNTALGGALYQDVATQIDGTLQHRSPNKPIWNRHNVQVREHSRLHQIIGRTRFEVNSSHHQAIKTIAAPLQATAWAEDGIVEAIEYPEKKFVLGVQWHPEAMENDVAALALLQEFINVCSQ